MCHILLFVCVLLTRADADPFASSRLALHSLGGALEWTAALLAEAAFFWWTLNILVDEASQYSSPGDQTAPGASPPLPRCR